MVPPSAGFSNPLPFNAMIVVTVACGGGVAGNRPLDFASRSTPDLCAPLPKGDL